MLRQFHSLYDPIVFHRQNFTKKKRLKTDYNGPNPLFPAIPHLFERSFLISWENNRDCHITMPLSLKTMEMQIKGDQWNKRFRTVQVYCLFLLIKSGVKPQLTFSLFFVIYPLLTPASSFFRQHTLWEPCISFQNANWDGFVRLMCVQ